MITVYDAVGGKLVTRPEIGNLSTGGVWIDLLNPAEDEDKIIEQALGIEVPTRSEMLQTVALQNAAPITRRPSPRTTAGGAARAPGARRPIRRAASL